MSNPIIAYQNIQLREHRRRMENMRLMGDHGTANYHNGYMVCSNWLKNPEHTWTWNDRTLAEYRGAVELLYNTYSNLVLTDEDCVEYHQGFCDAITTTLHWLDATQPTWNDAVLGTWHLNGRSVLPLWESGWEYIDWLLLNQPLYPSDVCGICVCCHSVRDGIMYDATQPYTKRFDDGLIVCQYCQARHEMPDAYLHQAYEKELIAFDWTKSELHLDLKKIRRFRYSPPIKEL